MTTPSSSVEIQEPPIKTIQKQRSCLWHSCLTGSTCLILLILLTAGLIFFSRDETPPSIVTATLPQEITAAAIPLYDTDNIDRIMVTKTGYRQKIASSIRQSIMVFRSPFALPTATSTLATRLLAAWQFPASEETHTVDIEWKDLSASTAFIENYYRRALVKNFFVIDDTTMEDAHNIIFHKDNVRGTVTIHPDPPGSHTAFVRLTLSFSPHD